MSETRHFQIFGLYTLSSSIYVLLVYHHQDGKEKNEDPDFVKELLDLHDKFTLLVEQQFGANALFQKALKVTDLTLID